MGTDFYMGLISGVISTLLASLIIYFVNNTRRNFKQKKEKYQYIWIPYAPIENNNEDIKHINKYPKDFKFEYKNGKFDLSDVERFVEGFECFKIHLTKLMLTEKWKYEIYSDNYGVSFNLMDAKNQEEFNQMSITVSNEILTVFRDFIMRIYSIKKYNDEKGIELSIGLKGINDIVTIDIPLWIDTGNN